MRLGVDSGRRPDQHLPDPGLRRALDLVQRVEHDERDAGLGRGPKLLVALVVAVDDDQVRRYAGAARERELAQGRDVRAQPFAGERRSSATF